MYFFVQLLLVVVLVFRFQGNTLLDIFKFNKGMMFCVLWLKL